MSRLRPGEAGPEARRVVDIAGTVGYSARALVFAVIGVFLIRAAWEHDPSETIGLDGALSAWRRRRSAPSCSRSWGPASVATPCGPRCRPVTARPERYARGVEAAASPQTLPWSWYVDPAVLATEQERVFRRHWQYVARRDQLDEPGRYVAARAGDVPVLLVRGREGCCAPSSMSAGTAARSSARARAAARRCSARTTPGRTTSTGRFAPPRARSEPGFATDGLGLVPLGVAT